MKLSEFKLVVDPAHQKIDPKYLTGDRPREFRPWHLFVVDHPESTTLRFHSACAPYHSGFIGSYGIEKRNIVGGGVVEMQERTLFVGSLSGDFGPIPPALQRAFALQIRQILHDRSIEIEAVKTNEAKSYAGCFIRGFWKEIEVDG